MHEVAVQITGYVEDSFPGFVSCVLRDARGNTWQFIEKLPVVSLANLTHVSLYPQAGAIRCNVISRSVDTDGLVIAQIDTSTPDGVESIEGRTRFDVFAEQLVAVASDV